MKRALIAAAALAAASACRAGPVPGWRRAGGLRRTRSARSRAAPARAATWRCTRGTSAGGPSRAGSAGGAGARPRAHGGPRVRAVRAEPGGGARLQRLQELRPVPHRQPGPLGSKPCERCFRSIGITAVVGVTSYCAPCNLEVGVNHDCGKTRFCLTCRRRRGGTIITIPRVTAGVRARGRAGPQARGHGVLRECRREAGPGHKHGATIWCYRCADEVIWPHTYHND